MCKAVLRILDTNSACADTVAYIVGFKGFSFRFDELLVVLNCSQPETEGV